MNSAEQRSPSSAGSSHQHTLQTDINNADHVHRDSSDNISSSTMQEDVVDGESFSKGSDHYNLQQKILKFSEQIKIEQKMRDDNVAEYLKLAENADKQQSLRIKSVFERKNQKSKANILQLQKKLETYHKKLKDLNNKSASMSKQQRYGFKDVGANLRDFSGGVVDSVKGSLSGISQGTKSAAEVLVTKPKDFASKLKKQFGSADNISSLQENGEDYQQFGSADNISNLTTNSAESMQLAEDNENSSPRLTQISRLNSSLFHMEAKISELEKNKSDSINLDAAHKQLEEEVQHMQTVFTQEINILNNRIQEQQFKNERLEEQLNDFVELHHHEVNDLRHELSSMGDKTEYLSQERTRDMQEALEACRTRITKMELQQQQQHRITMEGLEGATARTLIGKLFNLLMALLAVVLVFVSTVMNIANPLMKSQTRLLVSTIFIIISIISYNKWDLIMEYFFHS